MIWFWVPASLVICNDVFAYVWGTSSSIYAVRNPGPVSCEKPGISVAILWFNKLTLCSPASTPLGITLGRTQLFALSPKKTVEGFVGALFSTLIFGFFVSNSPLSAIALVLIVQWQWGSFWMRYDYMICPVKDLGANAWNPPTCKPNDVFVWRHYELMQPAAAIVSFLVRSFPWCWLVIQMLNDYCSAEGLSNRSLGLPISSTFSSWHASRVWSPLSEGSSRLDSREPSMSRILDRVSPVTEV